MASVSYLRLHADADGHSHFSDEVFPIESMGSAPGGAVLGSEMSPASHYGVRVVPPGWERDWGPAERPMLAVYLEGEAEIQASDGEVRRISPGLVLLAEDTTGIGHRVRVTGDEPVKVLQVGLPARPESANPEQQPGSSR